MSMIEPSDCPFGRSTFCFCTQPNDPLAVLLLDLIHQKISVTEQT